VSRFTRLRLLVATAAAVVAVATTGCSGSGSDASLTGGKVVEVTMKEMSFTPNRFTFKVGDTVTFEFHNDGEVRHEAVIGDAAAQQAALAQMRAMDAASSTTTSSEPSEGGRGRSRLVLRHPGMGLPNVISVEPGRSGKITFQFAKPATLLMECHEKGHLEAGMKATIVVTA
jgi:uncharacterized cupredoxin-like copper-binding protein